MISKGKKPDPADLVRKLTRDELESLVLERLVAEDKSLANAIVVRFAKSDAGGARVLVHSLVEGRTGNRYGMINDAEGLADELEELRKRARAWESPGKDLEAFALLRAIVEEVAPDCREGDDHDGILVGSVQETLDDIRSLSSRPDADPECREEIRAWARGNVEARWALEGDSWDFELILIQLADNQGEGGAPRVPGPVSIQVRAQSGKPEHGLSCRTMRQGYSRGLGNVGRRG